jgi:hypothetical protein
VDRVELVLLTHQGASSPLVLRVLPLGRLGRLGLLRLVRFGLLGRGEFAASGVVADVRGLARAVESSRVRGDESHVGRAGRTGEARPVLGLRGHQESIEAKEDGETHAVESGGALAATLA